MNQKKLWSQYLDLTCQSSIESLLNNLFGKDKSDYQNLLQSLSHDILTIMEIDKLKEKISTTLTEGMMLENVHLIVESSKKNFEVDCIAGKY